MTHLFKNIRNLLITVTVVTLLFCAFGCREKDSDAASGDPTETATPSATDSTCTTDEANVSSTPENGDETATNGTESEVPTETPTDSQSSSATDAPYEEPTQAPAVLPSDFDVSNINVGDRVSGFTVTEKKKLEDGSVSISLEGSLTVNGTLTKNGSGAYLFECSAEYSSFLPLPNGLDEPKYIILDSAAASSLTTADGALSITLRNYNLTITPENEVIARTTSFVQAKGEYAVLG